MVFNDKLSLEGRTELVDALASGRTSLAVEAKFDAELYRLCGYRVLGSRAVRIDILERLADFIRPAMSWRHNAPQPTARPEGAWDGAGFTVIPSMLSILGATHEDMKDVLKGLGYRNETKTEAEVLHQFAIWDAATTGESDSGEETQPSGVVEQDAEQTEQQTRNEIDVGEDNNTGENEEPKSVDIWRPAKSGGKSGGGQKKKHDRGAGKGKGREGQSKRSHSARKKSERASRPIDPDSPFAKLAALKSNLSQKDD